MSASNTRDDGKVIERLTRVARWTLVGGVAGGSWGTMLAYLRGQHKGFYAAAMGLNFAIASASFSSARELLMSLDSNATLFNSTAAAALSGGALTLIYAGPKKTLLAVALWGSVGFAGQYMLNEVQAWRRQQAIALLKEQAVKDAEAFPKPEPEVVKSAPPSSSFGDKPILSLQMKRQPNAPPPSSDLDAANADENASAHYGVSWVPSWFPVKIVQKGERERRLRKRLEEIDDLLDTVGEPDPVDEAGREGGKQQGGEQQP